MILHTEAKTGSAKTENHRAHVEIVFEDATLRILAVTMPPGTRTKRILYTNDYAVVPLTDGVLTRVVHERDTVHREANPMTLGRPYLRHAGQKHVDHYFINETPYEIRFQKVEFTPSKIFN